jgi:YbbR domain-containing protein
MNDDARGLWGLRLLALGLALLAWFVVSGEKREPASQKVVETSVRYDVPEGYLLLDRVERATVGVRGPVSRLRNLTPLQVDVFVEVPPEEGTIQVPLGPDHVALPSGLELVSVEPNVIELTLDREQTEVVEVVPALAGEPAAGAVVREARVVPNQALVRGPASRVRDLVSVTTTPVSLTAHALDFEEEAVVLPPDRMITVVEPRIVRVAVELEIPGAEDRSD